MSSMDSTKGERKEKKYYKEMKGNCFNRKKRDAKAMQMEKWTDRRRDKDREKEIYTLKYGEKQGGKDKDIKRCRDKDRRRDKETERAR